MTILAVPDTINTPIAIAAPDTYRIEPRTPAQRSAAGRSVPPLRERAASEQAASEQAASEQAASERAAAERTASERAASDAARADPVRVDPVRVDPVRVDPAATTEELLRQRDGLPPNHPDRVKLRARAIEASLPMANHLARRYAGRGEHFDDLAQVAALALIKAVDGYDPSREIAFAKYAVPSILGTLKRHFRDTAWGIRVPRSTQELARAVADATGELSQLQGRPPTSAELADHLQVSAVAILAALGARHAYHPASLNAPQDGPDANDLIDLIAGSDGRYTDVDEQLTLRPLFAALPLRERRILTMRFFDDMTQTQIAAEMGMSQMHVSRLLRRSLTKLRTELIPSQQ